MPVEPDPQRAALERALGTQYEVMRLLGRGGMGAVYLARDRSLDRLVAIKVLPPEAAGDPESRILRQPKNRPEPRRCDAFTASQVLLKHQREVEPYVQRFAQPSPFPEYYPVVFMFRYHWTNFFTPASTGVFGSYPISALAREISAKVTWGVPFEKIMEEFAKKTGLSQQTISLYADRFIFDRRDDVGGNVTMFYWAIGK